MIKVPCPNCKSRLDIVPIQKGDKIIGQNVFCTNMDCRYEIDKKQHLTTKVF